MAGSPKGSPDGSIDASKQQRLEGAGQDVVVQGRARGDLAAAGADEGLAYQQSGLPGMHMGCCMSYLVAFNK